jgi:multiple sugar transport system ATP-binding protein
MNLVDGKVASGRAIMAPGFELPVGATASGTADRQLTFGIRPEDIMVETGAPVEAKVHDVENHGVEKIVTLRVGDNMLRATVSAQTKVAIEDDIRFGWNPDKLTIFDRASGVSLRHAG